MTVMLAFPHDGVVRTGFMMSVISALTGDSPVTMLHDLPSGPVLSKARNEVTRTFLSSGCEWLWMCDTDMVFSAATLPALLAAADPEEHPVVSAFCLTRNRASGEVHPAAYTAGNSETGRLLFYRLRYPPADTLLRVAGTGAACLLVHRTAFTRLTAADPDNDGLWWGEITVDGNQFGEDLSFCLRCMMADVPVFVHTGIRVGHVKPDVLGEVSP